MPRPAAALASVVLIAMSAACSSSSTGAGTSPTSAPGSASGTTSPETAGSGPDQSGPDCASVWVPGKALPDDYVTCANGSAAGQQDLTTCTDGTRLIVFDDALWAVTGGPITQPDVSPLQDTQEYGKAFATCTGE